MSRSRLVSAGTPARAPVTDELGALALAWETLPVGHPDRPAIAARMEDLERHLAFEFRADDPPVASFFDDDESRAWLDGSAPKEDDWPQRAA